MMNDFTKEELGIIFCNLAVNDKTKEVLGKISNMFENYHCNHEHDGMIYTSNPPQNKCIKCGEFYR